MSTDKLKSVDWCFTLYLISLLLCQCRRSRTQKTAERNSMFHALDLYFRFTWHNIQNRLCKHGERFVCSKDVGRKSHKEFDKASGKSQSIGGSFWKKDPMVENIGKGHDQSRGNDLPAHHWRMSSIGYSRQDDGGVKILFSFSKSTLSKVHYFFILCWWSLVWF